GGEHRHQREAGIREAALGPEVADVERWKDRPEPIDPRALASDDVEDPDDERDAERGEAAVEERIGHGPTFIARLRAYRKQPRARERTHRKHPRARERTPRHARRGERRARAPDPFP